MCDSFAIASPEVFDSVRRVQNYLSSLAMLDVYRGAFFMI